MVRVIAEAGQCDGDPQYALEAIRQAAGAGCWGFKVQVLEPVSLVADVDTPAYWSGEQQRPQFETFQRAGVMDPFYWHVIRGACEDNGMQFVATPFAVDIVDYLEDEQLNVDWYKIASGDITFWRLLRRVGQTGKPVFLSTGASHPYEVTRAMSVLRAAGAPEVVPFACSLQYPCPNSNAQLQRIEWLRSTFPGEVGYSDHTLNDFTSMAATALGASYLEKHFTITPGSDRAPDHDMALSPARMKAYVHWAEVGAELRGEPAAAPILGTVKFYIADGEASAREGARRSLYATQDLESGHRITPRDFLELRPSSDGALSAWDASHVVGALVDRPVSAGSVIPLTALRRAQAR